MNRYSWVCFGASTPPHPARLLAAARSLLLLRQGGTNSEGRWAGWQGGAGPAAAGGSSARGAARRGGRVRACITRYQSHHLIWEAGLLHPSCKGEAEQDRVVFPTGAPVRGLDPATGPTPSPREPAMVAAPQGHPPPRREQSKQGAARNTALGPGSPGRAAGPPQQGQAGAGGGQRAML